MPSQPEPTSALSQDHPLDSLVVVAPFYNEEGGAETFHQRLSDVLTGLAIPRIELVFVDDGSTDNTLSTLNRIADDDPRVTILALSRNFGHQIALTAGLDHADADVVITMDSDLQHVPHLIPLMLEAYRAGADVVQAVRKNQGGAGLLKRTLTTIFYLAYRRLTKIRTVAGAADYRLLSRPVVTALRNMRETHRYLRGLVAWLGFPTTEIYYEQPERFAGKPTYSLRKSFSLARVAIFSFTAAPLRMVAWVGFALTLLAGLYLVYVLVINILQVDVVVSGWSSAIAVSLILGGVQLMALGILAEYIAMIFEQVKGRPLYALRQPDNPVSAEEKESPDKHA